MVKFSITMTTAQLTRANRIQGKTDGKRDLAAERRQVRANMRKRVRDGLAREVGRDAWQAVY
jgi:hypothetical protein